jgi:hypothetical protein
MAHDVVTGNADQSLATQHSVVSGDEAPTFPMLDITIPEFAPDGTLLLQGMVLLIAIARNEAVYPDVVYGATWTKVVDGIGGSGVFLDVYARTLDGTPGSIPGDVISFVSESAQELQGTVVYLRNALEATVIEATANGAFVGDASPAGPIINALLPEDTIVCIWSATGTVTFGEPAGFDVLDVYTSGDFTTRSILAASRTVDAAGDFDPGAAGASPAATGHAFSLMLHFSPPVVAAERPVSSRESNLGGLFDLYLDPVTLDYIDTEDGEWYETPDSRTLVMCMLEIELGTSYSEPRDGTRVRELLRRGTPVTPATVVAEVNRAMGILATASILSDFSIRTTDERGHLLVDETGRFSPNLRWTDLATGSPIDLVFTPFQG